MSQFDDYGSAAPSDNQPISAENFVATIAANVNNGGLDDRAFREFIRNTLPIVKFARPANMGSALGTSQFDDHTCQR